jgi:DNA-binding response OmpR family regulator
MTPIDELTSESATASREPGLLIALSETAERLALGARLQSSGFRVWTAPDGLRAFDTFLRHTGEIDALLLDAELPDIDVADFYRRLRSNFPGIPCALLSRMPHAPSVLDARSLGARVLARPVADSDLVLVLHDLAASDTSVISIAG